ncbi:hypothetical protein HMPREF0262_00616 [Clostridium sp. ATCC 29733]|nr:hypothetical protein HMPREF0262_00616 [Clostridium sp. ATCC 29733]
MLIDALGAQILVVHREGVVEQVDLLSGENGGGMAILLLGAHQAVLASGMRGQVLGECLSPFLKSAAQRGGAEFRLHGIAVKADFVLVGEVVGAQFVQPLQIARLQGGKVAVDGVLDCLLVVGPTAGEDQRQGEEQCRRPAGRPLHVPPLLGWISDFFRLVSTELFIIIAHKTKERMICEKFYDSVEKRRPKLCRGTGEEDNFTAGQNGPSLF